MKTRRVLAAVLLLILTVFCFAVSAEPQEDSRVETLVKSLAEGQKDPWVTAILQAGARDITWEDNTATFFLRGFDPDLKALGSYAKAADQEAWRQQAVRNISSYQVQVKVTFEEDGTVSRKQSNDLLNQVKRAAKNAKSSLAKKDWTLAMTDMMFCQPTTDRNPTSASLMTVSASFSAFIQSHAEVFPCEIPVEWAPIFYLHRNWRYTLNEGPHSLVLTWDGADPVKFLNQAYDHLTATLASVPGPERAKEDSLPYLWRSTLAETAITVKKGRLVTQSFRFDLDELISGKIPKACRAYFAAYTPDQYFERLVEGYRMMPEAAALPLPKSGVISMAKKGRAVMVKVAKDGRNTYVQLRDADTGVIQAEAFITPGKNVNLKVPEGVYTVQYATGATWYGTTELFGKLGNYTASDEFIVAKNKWVLVSEEEQKGIVLHAITPADFAPTEDRSIRVEGTLEAKVPLKDNYPENNPVIEGISSTTGLPASGEKYTPIVMVLDNAEDAYPHWGVQEADIIFQVPNAGAGATKLLGLFADHYPEQAGPVRSGRSSMLPAATSFNAAFAFAGPPALTGGQIDILELMAQYGMSKNHKVYNLLNNNSFGERWQGIGSHNLSCRIGAIHENLVNKEVEFEERPFLFTDEPRTEGATANIIRVLHRGDDPKGGSNSASRAVFKYDPETQTYIRKNSSGIYTDRLTGEAVPFSNVIVVRVKFAYERNYIYLFRHMTGSGTAEIFQNGKYVRGAWVRRDTSSRLILVDENGEELKLQRGKSFIVITNDVSDVIYTD